MCLVRLALAGQSLLSFSNLASNGQALASTNKVLTNVFQCKMASPQYPSEDEESEFISALIHDVVDDYSDNMVFEMLHNNEATRVYDVPEPSIPEDADVISLHVPCASRAPVSPKYRWSLALSVE